MKALSIRQPWAWFILCGFPNWKDVENREWPAPREMIGRDFQIHAPKTMTPPEFGDALKMALHCGIYNLPKFEDLKRGGIVGIVRLVKCTRISESPWFTGKFGFVLEKPYPLPFVPCPGERGFFEPLTF